MDSLTKLQQLDLIAYSALALAAVFTFVAIVLRVADVARKQATNLVWASLLAGGVALVVFLIIIVIQ